MSKQLPCIMTPDKYLQTDEQTLLEIAPHWRLMQVFPRGIKQAEYGFHTHNPYGTAIELLLRGKDVGAIVRFMKWGEKKSVYRRNRFIKFASVKFASKSMRETVHDVRVRQYDDRSRVGGYGEW